MPTPGDEPRQGLTDLGVEAVAGHQQLGHHRRTRGRVHRFDRCRQPRIHAWNLPEHTYEHKQKSEEIFDDLV